MAAKTDNLPRVALVANAVRHLMDKKSLSLTDVAKSMGVTRARVSQLVSGQHPVDKSIPGLAKALGTTEAALLKEAGL